MALALIGESILSAVIEVLADRLTSPEVLGFFKNHKLINDGLLEKLKETLNTINGLLNDAEEKQIKKAAVKNWLCDVKHAVYEAEDLLEEIDYEHLRTKDKAASKTVRSRVRNFVPCLNPANIRMKEIGAELEKIFEKLERLVKHKGDLHQIEGTIGGRPLSEKTGPLVDESDVYGRDDNKEAIMKLLEWHEANGPKVVVIPIVGMGGIGKTTLAQFVYNDRRVDDWFNLKVWVWVSEQFDVSRVIYDILQKVDDRSTCAKKEPNEYLKEALWRKKFLIVLDDMWDIEYIEWEKLLLPLKSAEQGSKIIVTTRNEKTAKVMQTVVPSYPLDGIYDQDCWKLFEKHAFSGVNSGAVSQLEAFGREIVRKCKGVPLAVKTLGGLLHSEGDVKEWEKIAKSNMWGESNENIPPALILSYYYLPSHLKRCFAYCAIFPKGYVFKKEALIRLWMQEGFVVQSKSNEEIERLGEKYYNDLTCRSFFQQSRYSKSDFTMHDLIIDLAEYVSGEFCFKFVGDGEPDSFSEGEDSCMVPDRTRYLSFTSRDDEVCKIFEHIHEVKHLRTLLPLSDGWKADSKVLNDIFTNLKRLRRLSFSESHYICQLPDSIGNLKLLRHLDLSHTSIEILPKSVCTLYHLESLILNCCTNLIKLPDSISNLKLLRHLDLSRTSIESLPKSVSTLYNLLTLILNYCEDLIQLPINISKLVNLQHLDIHGTRLKEMPSEMGKLTKLRKLTDFFLGKLSGSSIKELGKLLHLREKLVIWNLQNVEDVQQAMDANLKDKKQVEKLMLTWDGDTDDIQLERDILEKLEPAETVTSVGIFGYRGTMFPDWVGKYSFPNMEVLELIGCKNCISLPPLGQLPSLEVLSIEGFDEVVAVGSEFYGSDHLLEKPFKSLTELRIRKMLRWQEWNTDVAGAFPLLKKLHLEECPELTNALPSHLPSLLDLDIVDCPQLVAFLPVMPKLNRIDVKDSGRFISTKHSLKGGFTLHIKEDSLLKGMEQMSGISSSLREVMIYGCNSLKFCQLDMFPQLSLLRISNCLNLESLCKHEGRLEALRHLAILNCPNLVSLPKGGLAAPNLELLHLEGCPNLKMSPPENMHSLEVLHLFSIPHADWFPKLFPSLSHLSFGGYDYLKSFPEEMLLPSTLTFLEIQDLRNLKSLDYKGLQHLTSLRMLKILSCPTLESIPEQGLPSSIETLYIADCTLLEKRCKCETGEDWPKIAHVPKVCIGGRWI